MDNFGSSSNTTLSAGAQRHLERRRREVTHHGQSGGLVEVFASGLLSGATISSGGPLELFGGAVLSGTTTVLFDGVVAVSSGYVLMVGSGQISTGIMTQPSVTATASSFGLDSGAALLLGCTLNPR